MIDKLVHIVLSRQDTVIQITSAMSLALPETDQPIFKVLQELDTTYDYWIYFSREAKELGAQFSRFTPYLQHPNTMITAAGSDSAYVSSDIGYVEDGPFLTKGKSDCYPTWQMVDHSGVLHSSLLRQLPPKLYKNSPCFAYWLASVAKIGRPQGLCCYRIYLPITTSQASVMTRTQTYHFVARHYKKRWVWLLFLAHMLYEKQFAVLAFAKALPYSKYELSLDFNTLDQTKIDSSQPEFMVTVLIPTMGRADYLYQVLQDLTQQETLPQKVIIVEQNPDLTAQSALAYLDSESWPFEIAHIFTHQTGACNARNIGLDRIDSGWVLFFDDDVRCDSDFIAKLQRATATTGAKALTFACLQQGEVEPMKAFKQWESFGSGCSIVHSDITSKLRFDMALEHGYGEDVDYGMQIRHAGYDILYAPQIQVLHLKAPVGGFRQPHVFAWHKTTPAPKPSPQIMYHRQKNYTPKQLLGYKLVLFLKAYKRSGSFLLIGFYKKTKARWQASKRWAATL
ncbi:MAG: glycosyltransferase family 2 protein [Dokdonia sp.]|jgi:GT2 family glycosyltransferase